MMSKKINKSILVVVLVIVVGVGLIGFGDLGGGGATNPGGANNSGSSGNGTDNTSPSVDKVPCINSLLPMPPAYHIHPNLKIKVDGSDIPVPANIGISVSCERVLHTHDTSGEIHVEPNYQQVFTLGDFFGLWGKPLSKEQLLDKRADDQYEIVLTVDGQPSSEFENLVLRDKQQIVLEYRAKK